MDRKSVIILIISFVLLVLWYPLVNKLYPPAPRPSTQGVPAAMTNGLAGSSNGTPASAPLPPSPAVPAVVPQFSAPHAGTPIRPASPESIEILDTPQARYHFTSHGGGLKLIELKEYPATVTCSGKESKATQALASLNTKAPVPILGILGGEMVEGDGFYALTRGEGVVRAQKSLPNGLLLTKEFRPSSNYLVSALVRVENRTNATVRWPVQECVIGTSTPANLHDDASLMGLQWHDRTHIERIGTPWFQNLTLGCSTSPPRLTYESAAKTNLAWAAVHNQFFTVAAMLKHPAAQVVGRRIDLPPPSAEELASDTKAVRQPFGYQTALLYPEVLLNPGQVLDREFLFYGGPMKYHTLSKIGVEHSNNLDLLMSFDGFFGFFAKALLLGMNALAALSLPYAGAIIVITILIKLLFWPLTHASTKSMKRMSALQPQMKALQDKYKDDPKKMNQKLMEFMKENKVNPLGGCLPMLIQIPVFFGFFTMLRSAVELRGATFLWACDLSQPDTLFVIPGLNLPFNLLPIIMTATTLWQTHLTPPSPGMDPVQQKMMRYMPLMFIVILYNFSSALTLYWTVQNLLSILQMKLTQDDPVKPSAPPAPPAKAPRTKA
ncbi:MAG: membrane protein insertase YidC [Verrucomicrobia bacterium]|nr:membrane protein insertase YidC [Verrucomicrobiota bacterium]